MAKAPRWKTTPMESLWGDLRFLRQDSAIAAVMVRGLTRWTGYLRSAASAAKCEEGDGEAS